MRELFHLVVPVVPVAQPRQRHAMVNGHMRNYTPTKHPVTDFKATVRLFANQAGASPHDGPLLLKAAFYLPRPKAKMRSKDPDEAIPHTGRPDADNLTKSLKDSLTGILWRDDAQIYALHAEKWYHEKHGAPRVEIRLYGEENVG